MVAVLPNRSSWPVIINRVFDQPCATRSSIFSHESHGEEFDRLYLKYDTMISPCARHCNAQKV